MYNIKYKLIQPWICKKTEEREPVQSKYARGNSEKTQLIEYVEEGLGESIII